MKTLKYIFAILIFSVSFVSCSDDDESFVPDPMEGLNKIYEFSEADHSIQVYSEKQTLEAPHSMLSNSEESSVYKGHIVFQMASNETEYWEVTLNYNLNGQAIEKNLRVFVAQPADGLKNTQVFMGSDNTKYVLAFVNPKDPKVAINDMQAVLYKMENMMSFPIVENYKITVDPRMPGMGNHSSPNNQDLTYNAATKMYNGKLSLTMTGYWKINLKLMNANGDVLKGEDVTEANPASTLYFELEF